MSYQVVSLSIQIGSIGFETNNLKAVYLNARQENGKNEAIHEPSIKTAKVLLR